MQRKSVSELTPTLVPARDRMRRLIFRAAVAGTSLMMAGCLSDPLKWSDRGGE